LRALRFIFGNLDHFRARFLALMLVAGVDGAVNFSIPLILAEFTKGPLTPEAWNKLVPLLVLCTGISLLMQWIIRRFSEALGTHFSNYLRLRFFVRVEGQEVLTLQKHHSGYLLSLVSRVCDKSGGLAVGLLWLVAHMVVAMTLFFSYLAVQSTRLAIFNAVLLLVFLLVSARFSARMVPLLNEFNVRAAAVGERFVDIMGNILTVKRLRLRGFAFSHLNEKVARYDEQIRIVQRFHATRWCTLHTLFSITFLVTISLLLQRISSGAANASILILFISAYGTLRGHIERLSEMIKDLMEAGGYIATVDDILARTDEVPVAASTSAWDEICLDNISFSYPATGASISVPDFKLNKGDVICITGESGEGKSTFLALLAGLLSPLSGTRLIDGTSYEDAKPLIEGLFAITSQEVDLFSLSLRENLRLGRSLSDQEITTMLEELALGDWLRELPDGLSSEIGERGIRMSAGQRQRVNLARALLLRREIVLLDEPTSHLDATTEQAVVEALRKHLAGRTAVIVTHRDAVLALAHRRLVLRNGTLTETAP
jgi:ABC-type bacteriocin/lantibiotic exporter with double-glycine peptidase domain